MILNRPIFKTYFGGKGESWSGETPGEQTCQHHCYRHDEDDEDNDDDIDDEDDDDVYDEDDDDDVDDEDGDDSGICEYWIGQWRHFYRKRSR